MTEFNGELGKMKEEFKIEEDFEVAESESDEEINEIKEEISARGTWKWCNEGQYLKLVTSNFSDIISPITTIDFPLDKDTLCEKYKNKADYVFTILNDNVKSLNIVVCGSSTVIHCRNLENLSLYGMPDKYYEIHKLEFNDGLITKKYSPKFRFTTRITQEKGFYVCRNYPIHCKTLTLERMHKFDLRHITCDKLIFKNAGHYTFNWYKKVHKTLVFDGGFIQPDSFHSSLETLIIINGAKFSTKMKYLKKNYEHLTSGIKLLITDDHEIVKMLILIDCEITYLP